MKNKKGMAQVKFLTIRQTITEELGEGYTRANIR